MTSRSVERIAHYLIQRRVGRGGMGIVYKAMDERDGRIVALKVIRETEAKGDESATHVAEAHQRFQREADILRGLLHVNIVDFYEIGEEDGTPYLAMEFLEGQPLGAFEGRPWPETLPLLIQAANGMEYLSSRGIVHRDLSPDNVYVVEKGGERIVKLLDFGVAKLFEKASGSLTATGFFLGKVAYGSPEQLGSLGHGAELDWRSDVYSLGVIFYQVLAGRRPFEGKAPVEYIAAHLNTSAPPVAAPAGMPTLPMALVRLVAQMLSKRREERPKSYREIIDRLVSVHRSGAVDSSGSTALPAPAPHEEVTGATGLVVKRPAAGRLLATPLGRTVVGIVLLAALVGSIAIISLYRRRTSDESAGSRSPLSAAPVRATVPAVPAVAALVPPSGELRLVATPWANVIRVTEVATGEEVPLPKDAGTPLALTALRPGTYRVTLICSANGRTAERTVTVAPDAAALVVVPFLTTTELAQMLKP